MGSKTKQLVSDIDELISLLESKKEDHWCKWFMKAKARIINSDYTGVELILNAYGGMGSFNDLIICQTENEGKIEFTSEAKSKNEKLDSLRSSIWKLAEFIRREQIKNT